MAAIRLDLFFIPESRTPFRLNPGSRRTPSRPCTGIRIVFRQTLQVYLLKYIKSYRTVDDLLMSTLCH